MMRSRRRDTIGPSMSLPAPRFLAAGLGLLACVHSLYAEKSGPSTEQLKAWVAVREQRVDLLRTEIKQTDAHIEARLDVIIETLSSIADSKDSRTKVARMKEDTMKMLLKTIEYYDQKRAALRQDLRNPHTHLTEADKRKVIDTLEARINKRTQQILALHESMPSHADYDRYSATHGYSGDTDYLRNKDFEQNRRITNHTNNQRDAIVKQLDLSITRLERLGKGLREQLAATTAPVERKARAADLDHNDALLTQRRREKVEVLSSPGSNTQRKVALKEANDLDSAMTKAVGELRRDFTTLFERYHAFIREVTDLRATEANLAAKSAY